MIIYQLIWLKINTFFFFFYNNKYTLIFYKILFYFVCIYENNFNTNYNISKFYIFFSKLNSEQNFFILFFLILLINMYFNFNTFNIKLIYMYVFILFLYKNINLLDFYSVNINLNKNLTNGLLVIHPIILYFSYAFYIFTVLNLFFKHSMFINYSYFYHISKKFFLLTILFFFISIVLGAWWAEQELSWGGWWSWDLIEIISLNFFLIFCFLIHHTKYSLNMYFFYFDFVFKFILYFFYSKV